MTEATLSPCGALTDQAILSICSVRYTCCARKIIRCQLVIDEAYDDAEVIVMELDMDDLDPAYTQAAFNRAGVMSDGTTLRDLMGDAAYAEAEQRPL